MIRLLVALFVLSGFAGLVYESIWSRYLGLFVGHSAYAQVIVLVIKEESEDGDDRKTVVQIGRAHV